MMVDGQPVHRSLAQPGPDRRVLHRAAPSPQTAGRHLDEGHTGANEHLERQVIPARPIRDEVLSEGLERPRLDLQVRSTGRQDGRPIQSLEPATELALEHPVVDDLDERS